MFLHNKITSLPFMSKLIWTCFGGIVVFSFFLAQEKYKITLYLRINLGLLWGYFCIFK